jgi:hypothetical protein
MTGNIVGVIIFWVIGIIVALLGNRGLMEYNDYDCPKLYLAMSIFLCVSMSWALVFLSLIDDTCRLPSWLYHNCYNNSDITYEEEYLDKDGNKTDFKNCKTHNTYRVYTCRKCGKIRKEQI